MANRVLVFYGSNCSDRQGIRLAEFFVRSFRDRGDDAQLIDATAVGRPSIGISGSDAQHLLPPALSSLLWQRESASHGTLAGKDRFSSVTKAPLFFVALLAGCGVLPRDSDGTGNRVRQTGVVRIGVVASDTAGSAAAQALAARVANDAGARPQLVSGAADTLLTALDADRVDLVIAPFVQDTPWASEVALAPPVAQSEIAGRQIFVRAAVRNGENRWAMLVEHASRAVAPALADAG